MVIELAGKMIGERVERLPATRAFDECKGALAGSESNAAGAGTAGPLCHASPLLTGDTLPLQVDA